MSAQPEALRMAEILDRHAFQYGETVYRTTSAELRRLHEVNGELLDALRDVLRIAKAASIGIAGNAPRIARAEAAIAKSTGGSAA